MFRENKQFVSKSDGKGDYDLTNAQHTSEEF